MAKTTNIFLNAIICYFDFVILNEMKDPSRRLRSSFALLRMTTRKHFPGRGLRARTPCLSASGWQGNFPLWSGSGCN